MLPSTESDIASASRYDGDCRSDECGLSTDNPRRPSSNPHDLVGQRARQRSADEIETTIAETDRATTNIPELPALEDDVYLLEPDTSGKQGWRQVILGSLHALALDTALSAGGDVVWVDAQGHATTHTLARIAPSKRTLDRVHVARAFTTHQHCTLIEQVNRWLQQEAESPFGTPATDRPAVLICPALDALYRAGELRESISRALLTHTLAVVTAAARAHALPVVLTRTRDDDYAAPIEQAATTISVEQTAFGPRFECDALDFETLVYPADDGTVQTTFAFWRSVLESRHPDVVETPDTVDRPAPAITAGPGEGGW